MKNRLFLSAPAAVLSGLLFVSCTSRDSEGNVRDATIVTESAAPSSGHADLEMVPDSMDIQPSDTAVHKKR